MGQLFKHLAAFSLVALTVAPGVALADGARHHYGKHDWRNFRQPNHFQPYKRHHDPYRRGHQQRPGRFHGSQYGQVYSLVPPWPGYGCRPVVVIDRYRGAKARGSGSLCFDSFGRAFIVRGRHH